MKILTYIIADELLENEGHTFLINTDIKKTKKSDFV